jgi:hypothetical protein
MKIQDSKHQFHKIWLVHIILFCNFLRHSYFGLPRWCSSLNWIEFKFIQTYWIKLNQIAELNLKDSHQNKIGFQIQI